MRKTRSFFKIASAYFMSWWPEGAIPWKWYLGSPESELSGIRWCTDALVSKFCSKGLTLATPQRLQCSPCSEMPSTWHKNDLGPNLFAALELGNTNCWSPGKAWRTGKMGSPCPTVTPFRKMIYYSFLLWKWLRCLLLNPSESHLHLSFDYCGINIFLGQGFFTATIWAVTKMSYICNYRNTWDIAPFVHTCLWSHGNVVKI